MSTEIEADRIPVPPEGADLLVVDGLVKHFPIRKGVLQRQVGAVQAVDGLTFRTTAPAVAGEADPAAARRRDGILTVILLLAVVAIWLYFS